MAISGLARVWREASSRARRETALRWARSCSKGWAAGGAFGVGAILIREGRGLGVGGRFRFGLGWAVGRLGGLAGEALQAAGCGQGGHPAFGQGRLGCRLGALGLVEVGPGKVAGLHPPFHIGSETGGIVGPGLGHLLVLAGLLPGPPGAAQFGGQLQAGGQGAGVQGFLAGIGQGPGAVLLAGQPEGQGDARFHFPGAPVPVVAVGAGGQVQARRLGQKGVSGFLLGPGGVLPLGQGGSQGLALPGGGKGPGQGRGGQGCRGRGDGRLRGPGRGQESQAEAQAQGEQARQQAGAMVNAKADGVPRMGGGCGLPHGFLR